ncbi:leucine-rich repeat domain-containing protein [Fictibacillus aquaticus]|uniref:Internalin n=1 Tax=Fictibacillus aquaticus TaxID=2021314 RepID=A0A235F8M2_9BACL|nr:leucine-rich repeat domain-containing protein [Fictibacillus aquaticus]OYD57592.1 hypothetical protein CGZ90_13065 [Fictibacillus aquaticus]
MKLQKDKNVILRVYDDGEVDVMISSKYLDECIEYINLHHITKIDIKDLYYEGEDLEFLSQCPTVKKVSIASEDLKDISGLFFLENVTHLAIEGTTIVKKGIDFSLFPNLESLGFQWNKKLQGFHQLPALKELYLCNYAPKHGNLEELSALNELEELTITQSKVRTLQGIQHLSKLRKLELNYMRTLTSLEGIEGLDSLQRLDITSCKNITDLSRIQSLNSLEWVFLDRCGEIPSIGFVQSLHRLKHFVFPKTNVLDGDITLCLHIDYVHFDSKKHYSHKWTDVEKWSGRFK